MPEPIGIDLLLDQAETLAKSLKEPKVPDYLMVGPRAATIAEVAQLLAIVMHLLALVTPVIRREHE